MEPNAHYDMAHGKPKQLEHDNDGSSIFRFNIEPEMAVPEGGTEEVQVGWKCVEVRFWGESTKKNIKKAVIRNFYDETAEFDLVNSYNKHVLHIAESEQAVADYAEFLQFTEDLDALITNVLNG